MLTIEEGISRFESFANLCEKNGMHEWQKEHEQYVAWLRELVERRKAPEIVYCHECKHKNTHNCFLSLWATVFNSEPKDDFFCGMAERKTDE